MKHNGYRILAVLTVITLLAALPLPVTTGNAESEDDDEKYRIVKDHVPIVVSMGDSFSSGEGAHQYYNQDKPIESRVADQDWLAHRAPTAWSGLLTFKDENGNDVHMNQFRYDSEALQGLPAEEARWFFVASSGAVTDDIFSSQGKAYHIDVYQSPLRAEGSSKYMTYYEIEEYYTSHGIPKDTITPLERRKIHAAKASALEDNAKGKVDGKLFGKDREEPLIDPQRSIFGIPEEDVEYVTITIGGNDLGFVDIVNTAAKDFIQDFDSAVDSAGDSLYSKALDKLKESDDRDTAEIVEQQWDSYIKVSDILSPNDGLAEKLSMNLSQFEEGVNGKESIHDKLLDVYNEIHDYAPYAVILVAGYPKLFDGAVPNIIFAKNDIDLINRKQDEFQKKLSTLIRNLRESTKIPIYFIPVDGIGAFQGRGAYSTNSLLNPVLIIPLQEMSDYSDEILKNVPDKWAFSTNQDSSWSAYDQELMPAGVVAAASMHPNEEGHGVYADCVQKFIENRIPIEATGLVRQVDENQELSPVPKGCKVVLKLADGPIAEGDERLSELKVGDEVYQGAIKGEYTADVAADGNFTVKVLSGKYHLTVLDKDGEELILYGTDWETTVDVQLMHHNRKDMDIRVVPMQEISGLIYAVDEKGNKMEIDCSDFPVILVLENQDIKKADKNGDSSGFVGSVVIDSIPKDGMKYKLKVPVGTTDIMLRTDIDGELLPLYNVEDDMIRIKISVKKPARQDVTLEVKNVLLTGQITAEDGNSVVRDYDLSKYPLELQLSQGNKKQTWSTDWISEDGTTYSFEAVPGDYVLTLTGKYKEGGYTLLGTEKGALTVTLPLFQDTEQDLDISVDDQKLSGRLFARDRDGKKVKADFADDPLLLEFIDRHGEVVRSWQTGSIGTGGVAYSLMLPPGTYTVGAVTRDGSEMQVLSDDGKQKTVTVSPGTSAKSDISIQVKNQDYLGIWSKEITAEGFFGVSAGVRLELNIEENKITLTMAETSDLSTLGYLGIDDLPEIGGSKESYTGKWSETDDGIAMDISGEKIYFILLNEDQLYMDLDRLKRDAVAQGAADMVLLLEALESLAYVDVGSIFGFLGGFDMGFGYNTYDMMGVDSIDDMFVFTREK